MKKFFITTLGCKVNQAESDAISSCLKAADFLQVGSKFKPDPDVNVCVINTCTVTGKASMQSRQAVRRAIRNFPNAKIIVTGCYAQTQPEELDQIPGVDNVLGHADKFRIPEFILNNSFSKENCSPFMDTVPSDGVRGPLEGSKTRAVLKIQDGCNAVCTYCIVPKARGKSRSMPQNRVLESLSSLKQAGYREVVFSGIHLGSYGEDLAPKTTLSDLLLRINLESDMDRIRLSSIEPKEVTDRIIQLVSSSDQFCRHLHIPLQSGDDTILRKMARPYDSHFFRQLVLKIKEQVPDVSIGTDVLVGFPGEADDLFENTRSFVASLPLSYLHVFPYSPRQNTPASRYAGGVPATTVKARCERMRALGRNLTARFYNQLVGRTTDVLIESGPLSDTGYFTGRTSNYVPVYLKIPGVAKNTLVQAKITERYGDKGVVGVPV